VSTAIITSLICWTRSWGHFLLTGCHSQNPAVCCIWSRPVWSISDVLSHSWKGSIQNIYGRLRLLCHQSSTCILCLKRFIGRRSLPNRIFCDNATNFVGTRTQLEEFKMQLFSQQALKDLQMVTHIKQQFWDLWRRDYLHTLQARSKWLSPKANIVRGSWS